MCLFTRTWVVIRRLFSSQYFIAQWSTRTSYSEVPDNQPQEPQATTRRSVSPVTPPPCHRSEDVYAFSSPRGPVAILFLLLPSLCMHISDLPTLSQRTWAVTRELKAVWGIFRRPKNFSTSLNTLGFRHSAQMFVIPYTSNVLDLLFPYSFLFFLSDYEDWSTKLDHNRPGL